MKKIALFLLIGAFGLKAMKEDSTSSKEGVEFQVIQAGFNGFYENIMSHSSNIYNFVDGWNQNTISWQDVKDEFQGGLAKKPQITLDEFLSVVNEAADKLKEQNQVTKQKGYVEQTTKHISGWLYGRTFEPYKAGKIFSDEDTIHIFGAQHSSVHDLMFLLNLGFGDDGTIFKKDLWKLKDKYKNHHFVITSLVGKGLYGIETVYAALQVFLANPDNVQIVQGLNELKTLKNEIMERYASVNEKYVSDTLSRLYAYLPVAFFAGFEKTFYQMNLYYWYQCVYGGIQKNDKELVSFLDNCIEQEGETVYAKVSGFGKNTSTNYQNIAEDTKNLIEQFKEFDGSNMIDSHALKGILFGGHHERNMNTEMQDIATYGFYSQPGSVSLAPTPLSLFGITKNNEYSGVIHRTSLRLTKNYLDVMQHPNVDILKSIKINYAQTLYGQFKSYMVPLYVDTNRIIAQLKLGDDYEMIPKFTVNVEMFREEENIERISEDLKEMNIESPEMLIEEPSEEDVPEITEVDIAGTQKAEQELSEKAQEDYQELVKNPKAKWQIVIEEQRKIGKKKITLWNFLMSIKPQSATDEDWIATVNDSYFWTHKATSLKDWKNWGRIRWRDYLARQKLLKK